jgi:nucleotide sugar dehydrogenase
VRITTVGLGKIGLPLAVQYSRMGHKVIGTDISKDVVNLINMGQEPFPGEMDLGARLKESVDAGSFFATTETSEAVSSSDAVVVAVPLYIDEKSRPDFQTMDLATRDIGKGLRAGTLVAFETTLPVGTTRNRLAPILEQESGLVAGKDFFVVFSPERVLTGRVFADLRKYPKLVGGINPESEEKGRQFYESVLDFDERPDLQKPNGVWMLGSSEAAELAKLAETTYRDVNIALANQFALHAEKIGIDIYPVIDACNSQSFSHIHQPGISVGGHCIPVYPHLYLQGDPGATIVSAARASNKKMPAHAVDIVEKELGSLVDATVAILGFSYRPGVKESAFSGTWDLVEEITSRGGKPRVHDPLYSDEEIKKIGLVPFGLGDTCNAAIIHTAHSEYLGLDTKALPGVRVVVDGRNVTGDKLKSQVKTFVLGIGE